MAQPTNERLITLESKAELGRRDALKVLAAAIAAAQAACIEPPGDQVRPYARQPAALTPGVPKFFATSLALDGYGTGLVVETHEGRPTKVEGNPTHPASLGATLAQHQAAVLDLYDPDRAHAVTCNGAPSSWLALSQALRDTTGPLWLVMSASSSPLEGRLLERLQASRPSTRIVWNRPFAQAESGSELAFGRSLDTQYDFARASIVVSLDADLFSRAPMAVRWAHDFAARKRATRDAPNTTRTYVVEPMLTPTGSLADHRLALRASEVPSFALALLGALMAQGVRSVPSALAEPAKKAASASEHAPFLRALANDLLTHPGASVVAVGERQPPVCHALGHVLNFVLGNVAKTVHFTTPTALRTKVDATLEDLAASLERGEVGTVVVLDDDPVHRAPPALSLGKRLTRAKLSVHIGAARNETSEACQWQAPLAHAFESWGDTRAADGTHTVLQPLIQPLYDARSRAEALATIAGELRPRGYTLLRESLGVQTEADEARWNRFLAKGLSEGSATASEAAALVLDEGFTHSFADVRPASGVEVDLAPSQTIGSERQANNAWLQELPHPRTKQTWGNAALVSPALAAELGVSNGMVVKLQREDQSIELPVLIVEEHADRCVTVELGYGMRAPAQRIANGVGANGYALTLSSEERVLRDLVITKTKKREPLARTQDHVIHEDRGLAPAVTKREPKKAKAPLPTTLAPVKHPESPQWAMTIDTTVCSGCSACVIACQSENNVPVVGKHEVARGREMHWLRIDSYLLAGATTSPIVHQPMMCQHCEHAPCEYVCPVFATEHSPDGLNEMVYNRCIGTRFCQANCPYKVRRFNWLHYSNDDESRVLQKNPEVTVRDRGVMEKCTYCVQRIRHAEYHARMERRAIRPREVVTACQQACPTNAIQFGMLSDHDSDMVRDRESALAYASLEELGTRPRTMYLKKQLHPNEELEERT